MVPDAGREASSHIVLWRKMEREATQETGSKWNQMYPLTRTPILQELRHSHNYDVIPLMTAEVSCYNCCSETQPLMLQCQFNLIGVLQKTLELCPVNIPQFISFPMDHQAHCVLVSLFLLPGIELTLQPRLTFNCSPGYPRTCSHNSTGMNVSKYVPLVYSPRHREVWLRK